MNVSRRTAILGGAGLFGSTALASLLNFQKPSSSTTRMSQTVDYISRHISSSLVAPRAAIGDSDLLCFDESHVLHAKLLLHDADLPDATIDGLWETYGGSAFVGQYDLYVPLYEINDSAMLVGLALPALAGGGRISVTDVAFCLDDDTGTVLSDCEFDYDTGLAYVPLSTLDDVCCAIQCQMLVSVSDCSDVSIPWSVRRGANIIASGETHGQVTDMFTVFDCGDVLEGLTVLDLAVKFDGADQFAMLGPSSVSLDDGVFTLCVCPAFLCGVEIFVPDVSPLMSVLEPTRAFAIESDDMTVFPYGFIYNDEALVKGRKFDFSGRFLYPEHFSEGWGATIRPAYVLLHSSMYWWRIGTEDSIIGWLGTNGDQPWMGSGDATSVSWEAMKDIVLVAPWNAGFDSYATPGWPANHMPFVDPYHDTTKELYIYSGQLISLPGTPGTSDYTLKDLNYWSTLVSNFPSTYTQDTGIVPAMCMHSVADSRPDDAITHAWHPSIIHARILDTNIDSIGRGYIVLGLTSDESSYNENTLSLQGAGCIYKIEVRPRTTTVTINKSLVDANDTPISDDMSEFSFTIMFSDGLHKYVTIDSAGVETQHESPASGTSHTFVLKASESIRFEEVAVGSTYSLVEVSVDGYISTIDKPTGTVSELPVTISVVNKRNTGYVTFVKSFE